MGSSFVFVVFTEKEEAGEKTEFICVGKKIRVWKQRERERENIHNIL